MDCTYYVPGTVLELCVYWPTSSSLHHPRGPHYYSLLQLSKLGHQVLHAQGPTAGKWQSVLQPRQCSSSGYAHIFSLMHVP